MSELQTFWTINPDNGKLNPEILDIYSFLECRGFCKRSFNGEIELFRKNSHFIQQTYTSDQINEISAYLEKEFTNSISITIEHQRKDDETINYEPRDILERLVKYGWGKIFNENNWNHLPELDVDIKKHTRDQAFFYFQNGYVEVTATDVKLHPYSDFAGKYIYKDYLIDKPIRIIDVDDDAERDFAPRGIMFLNFLSKIAGIPDDDLVAQSNKAIPARKDISGDPAKFQYLMKLIGFLLHDYKQQGLTDHCVILCDDNSGGSGKGLLIQALSQMTKVGIIDCRKEVGHYDPEEITERTRIKVYNDVPQSFNFGLVYNEITDGGTIRWMYKSPRPLSYADTWKVLITSNWVIRGNSGPDRRRQKIFSMHPFFNDQLTVQDYYNHSFFSSDWHENDWNMFFNIMFRCVQMWLASGYKVSFVDLEYNQRRLEAHFPLEIREYIDQVEKGCYHNTGELFWNFKNSEKYQKSVFVRQLKPNLFGRLLTDYLEEMKIKFHRNHNRTQIYIEKEAGKQ